MLRIRNYFIAFAVVFAISSAYALIGAQDAKAEAMDDLIKRIEALESTGGGNVTTGARGLKIGLQIRTRFELKSQFMMDTGNTSSRSSDGTTYNQITSAKSKATNASHRGIKESHEFVLQRTRLTFDFDVNKNVRARFMISDNRTFGADATLATSSEVGTTEAYVDLRNLGDISSVLENVTIRIGRWQMFYGDHRLIGHLNWGNTGRVWDGGKVRWDNKKGSWAELFVTKVRETFTGTAPGDAPTSEGADELFWGLYTHFKVADGLAAEPYLIIRDRSSNDRKDVATSGGEERYTAGLRLVGKKIPSLPGIDFKAEQAWQFGHNENAITAGNVASSENIQAFAGAWGVGYTFSNMAWSPRIGYQYAFASGDKDPDNGADKTFAQLYPTGHARMGYMDFHAWQNIRAHKIELSFKPTKKLLVKADTWFFEADNETDDWYGVTGTTTREGGDTFTNSRGVTGNIDDEYGTELDITMKYKLFKNFGVVAGYSHYWSGDFMEDTNDGTDRDADWVYLMSSLKF